jgi:hypothetical protein
MTTNSPDQAEGRVAAQPFAKIYASRFDVQIRDLIPVFHDWIKRRALDELLIDVHDYSHVHEGPGVILVGHEAHYGMDRREGRLGMVYRARRTPPGPIGQELGSAVRRAANAAKLASEALDGLAFDAGELLVGFEDRLRAPNDAATFEAFAEELEQLTKRLFTGAGSVERAGEERDVFSVRLTGEARPLGDLAS